MDAPSDDYSLLLPVSLVIESIRDGQVLAFVASDRSAEGVSGHMAHLLGLDFTKVVCKHGVGVRH